MKTKNSKHTPGPWEVMNNGDSYSIRATDKTSVVYRMQSGSYLVSRGQVEANARLIAAAPELLDALKYMLATFTTAESAIQHSARMNAKAVISQVKGKP